MLRTHGRTVDRSEGRAGARSDGQRECSIDSHKHSFWGHNEYF